LAAIAEQHARRHALRSETELVKPDRSDIAGAAAQSVDVITELIRIIGESQIGKLRQKPRSIGHELGDDIVDEILAAELFQIAKNSHIDSRTLRDRGIVRLLGRSRPRCGFATFERGVDGFEKLGRLDRLGDAAVEPGVDPGG